MDHHQIDITEPMKETVQLSI